MLKFSLNDTQVDFFKFTNGGLMRLMDINGTEVFYRPLFLITRMDSYVMIEVPNGTLYLGNYTPYIWFERAINIYTD